MQDIHEANMLRFVHITDTHIGSTADYTLGKHHTLSESQALIRHLNDDLPFPIDFVLHTGDLTYDPDEQAQTLAAQTYSNLKYPTYYVRGNHDSAEAFCKTLPNLPTAPDKNGRINYDFIIKDFHFIVLDSFGTVQPSGLLLDEQLVWLEEKCGSSTAKSLVIALHHLPTQTGVPWFDERMLIHNHDDLFTTLRPYQSRIRGLFYGHIHRGSVIFRDGIMCVSAFPIAEPLHSWPHMERHTSDADMPSGYNLVTLTHEQTWINCHTVPRKDK